MDFKEISNIYEDAKEIENINGIGIIAISKEHFNCLIDQCESIHLQKSFLEKTLVSTNARGIEKRIESERDWFQNQSELIEKINKLKNAIELGSNFIEGVKNRLDVYEKALKAIADSDASNYKDIADRALRW